MESIAPPLELLWSVKSSLEAGETLRKGISNFILNHKSSFSEQTQHWLNYLNQGLSSDSLLSKESSIYRVQLFLLLEQGLRGSPIYSKLLDFELELIRACENEIQEHLDSLHFKILIPILIFQFPAFLLLLFGPLLNHLKN